MKVQLGVFVVASLVVCGGAYAQPEGYDQTNGHYNKPAVSNPSDTAKSPAAPVPGKNSFTESEVKSRLEKHGYSGVSNLTKDDNSVWHASAQRGGRAVNVTIDYQGNITEQ